MVTNQN